MLFVVFASSLAYAAQDKAPDIEIATPDVDMGELEKGKIFDYRIDIKNTGTGNLVIENVYSTCGCLEVKDKRWPANSIDAIKPKQVTVKPGQGISVAVAMDTNKVSGAFERMIHVISNDPDNKDVVWKIKGRVLDSANMAGQDVRSNNIVSAQYSSSEAPQTLSREDLKVIMVFYAPGCKDCKEIMDKFLPGLKEKYREKILIVDYNIENPESFAFLLDLQNKYDERSKSGFFNPKPPAVFTSGKLLYGVKEIKEKLEDTMGVGLP
jgi:thiol-disulfide isomerase/thioredoxin